jgi:hypothetical protein
MTKLLGFSHWRCMGILSPSLPTLLHAMPFAVLHALHSPSRPVQATQPLWKPSKRRGSDLVHNKGMSMSRGDSSYADAKANGEWRVANWRQRNT